MKFQFTILIVVFISLSLSAQTTEIEYKLDKKQRALSTFSGDIDEKSSIHCIIYQDNNTIGYGIKPFYVNDQDSITALHRIDFFTKPTIRSFHKNGNQLILIVSQTENRNGKSRKKISILDIDITTKEVTRNDHISIKSIGSIIRLPNTTILLDYSLKKKLITSISINDSSDIIETTHTISKEQQKYFKEVNSSSKDFINTNKYLKNGSVSSTKIYYDNGLLIFDYYNIIEKQSITFLVLDPKVSTATAFTKYKKIYSEKIKDMNSFYHQGVLFLVYKTKEKTKLAILDPKTGNLKYKASLQDDFSGYFNSEKLNIIDKKIKRPLYKPTITVNKSIENHNVIRISYVYLKNYNYNNDFFWMHQQMMMHQQMVQPAIPSGFGPHMPIDYYYTEAQPKAEENEFIELVFDNELNPIKDASVETIRKYIDQDLYLEPLSKQKGIKHLSAAFTEKAMRTIMYYKKTKKFVLKIAKL